MLFLFPRHLVTLREVINNFRSFHPFGPIVVSNESPGGADSANVDGDQNFVLEQKLQLLKVTPLKISSISAPFVPICLVSRCVGVFVRV